ncbi:MAG: hypothetical protein N3D84_01860 [Candidatus Woesearchaeota archaeon]|nr:hypothetical protein [Candidatus Woesearchaeota archaeon]
MKKRILFMTAFFMCVLLISGCVIKLKPPTIGTQEIAHQTRRDCIGA